MKENNNENIKVAKKKLVKVILGAVVVGALMANATDIMIDIAKRAHQKKVGATAITREVIDSGVFPEHLNARYDSQSGILFNYVDVDGNRVNVVDSDAFVNDIVVEAMDDYGFSVDEMAVVLEYKFDYYGVKGATDEGMEQAKMAAYHQEMYRELSGRSL